MKLSLPANIGKLRKAHSMTQEQLAEALGVTFASVSKWERGAATPELSLIAQMADLFGVSVDTLVGFELQNNSVVALAEKILDLQRQKQYTDAFAEAEKALLRYPNDFRIVYRAGELYAVAGVELKNEKHMYRSIALLERAVLLLSQNDDPKISEVSIQNEIAQCYISLGKHEKGLEILKKYNVCGVHDALIATTYTAERDCDPKKAEPYMMSAFGNILMSAVRTMMAYANYYFRANDYTASRDALLWLIDLLRSIKVEQPAVENGQPAVAYVDKLIAPCYSECASLSLRLGETEKVAPYLHRAYQIAKAFDAAPTYKFNQNIKFCVGDCEKATAYDDWGESALSSIERQLTQDSRDERLLEIWQEIVREDARGGKDETQQG